MLDKYGVVQKFLICVKCGSPDVQVRRLDPPFGYCLECEQDVDLKEDFGTEDDLI